MEICITNIQRFSVHDGPGIRTVVFAKGCPLRCKWCQNPENLKPEPQLLYYAQKCIGCGKCLEVCPEDAIQIDEGGISQTDRNKCVNCGQCAAVCVTEARILCGKRYSADDVVNEVMKDGVVYNNTGGGITLGGGDFIYYPDFTCILLEKCKYYNLHTVIETSGYCSWKHIESIARLVDLFYYDIKIFDTKKHHDYTGVYNQVIVDNLRKLVEIGKTIVIRIPLVPEVNDDAEEFKKIVQLVASLKTIDIIHILPFHQIGESKYEALGMDYSFKDVPEMDGERVKQCEFLAINSGLRVNIGGSGFLSEKPEKKVQNKSNFFIYDF